jgi:hypothetical protein
MGARIATARLIYLDNQYDIWAALIQIMASARRRF